MYCSNCGKEINSNAVFCSNCGVKIEHNSVQTPMGQDIIVENQEPGRGDRKRFPIIIGVVAVCLCIVLVAGILILPSILSGRSFSLLKKKKPQKVSCDIDYIIYSLGKENLTKERHVSYEYEDNGKIEKLLFYSEDNELESYSISEYNQSNDIVNTTWYDSDNEIKSKIEREYDSNKQLSKVVYYDQYGSMTEKYEYEYDDGKETLAKYYNDEGVLQSTTKYYKHDKDGNVLKFDVYDEDGDYFSTYVMKYNSYGDEVERVQHNGQMVIDKVIHEYVYKE